MGLCSDYSLSVGRVTILIVAMVSVVIGTSFLILGSTYGTPVLFEGRTNDEK